MSDKQKNPGNDRITEKVQQLGYCCPLSFFLEHTGNRWPHKKVAYKLGLGHSTIEFNRRKLRAGEMTCTRSGGCKGCVYKGDV